MTTNNGKRSFSQAEEAAKQPTLATVRELAKEAGTDDAKRSAARDLWRLLSEDDRGLSCKEIAKLLDMTVPDLRGKPESTDDDERRSQADELTHYADDLALFVDANDGDAVFADITVDGHRETHKVDSKGFRDWLRSRYFAANEKAARGEAVLQALETIAARAKFTRPVVRRKVFLRSACVGAKVYLDLCDDDWRVIEVDASGWAVVSDPDVRFRRTKGMLPIPEPTRGGSVGELRPLLNVKSDDDFVLSVGFLLQALRGKLPFVHVVLRGEQGTGKSTYALTLRSIIDPAGALLRSPPRNEDDLFVAGTESFVLAFDNLSGMPGWLSDALCRMGDGGTFGKREHFSNDEEALLRGGRPMIFNGIDEAITRGDLADRVVFTNLEPITEEKRLDDDDLALALDRARPGVLGALLDAVSVGLRDLATTKVKRLPRMASFAKWVSACESALCGLELSRSEGGGPVLWKAGTFMQAYLANRAGAVESVLSADVVSCELRDWLTATARARWEGSPSTLFQDLSNFAANRPGNPAKSKGWPANAASMTNAIRRAAPALRKVGVDFSERKSGSRRLVSFVVTPHGKEQGEDTHSSQYGATDGAEKENASASNPCSESSHSSQNGAADGQANGSEVGREGRPKTEFGRAGKKNWEAGEPGDIIDGPPIVAGAPIADGQPMDEVEV